MSPENRYRILLLDTDSQYLADLFEFLSPYYEICVLNDSAQALAKIDLLMPDMIVTEMDLPGMDGIKFVRQVRKIDQHRNIPIVFLSHRDKVADMRLGYMVKADRCLPKTGNLSSIAAEIGNLLLEKGLPVRHKPTTLEVFQEELHQEAIQKNKPSPPPPPPPVEEFSNTDIEGPDQLDDSDPLSAAGQAETQERLRVLIADTEAPQLASLHSLFGTFCDCVTTNCGIAAIEKADSYLPDVLILNMRLNNLQGFEVAHTLRNHPAFRSTPIFGLLAAADPLHNTEIEKKYGVSILFEAPGEFGLLCAEVQNLLLEPNFIRESYPLTMEEIHQREEALLLQSQKRKGHDEAIRRDQDLRDFLKNSAE